MGCQPENAGSQTVAPSFQKPGMAVVRRLALVPLHHDIERSSLHGKDWEGACSWGPWLSQSSLLELGEGGAGPPPQPHTAVYWSPPCSHGSAPSSHPASLHSCHLASTMWEGTLVNKQASALSNVIQRLSFPSSNPVTGITRQHCDVLFSMRCLS